MGDVDPTKGNRPEQVGYTSRAQNNSSAKPSTGGASRLGNDGLFATVTRTKNGIVAGGASAISGALAKNEPAKAEVKPAKEKSVKAPKATAITAVVLLVAGLGIGGAALAVIDSHRTPTRSVPMTAPTTSTTSQPTSSPSASVKTKKYRQKSTPSPEPSPSRSAEPQVTEKTYKEETWIPDGQAPQVSQTEEHKPSSPSTKTTEATTEEEPTPDASPIPKDALHSMPGFATGNGNISCQINANRVACLVYEHQEFGGEEGRPLRGVMDSSGQIQGVTSVESGTRDPEYQTLEDGQSAASGKLACTSLGESVQCWNAQTGSGFKIGPAGIAKL